MTQPTNPEHDLEDHIPALRELNRVRRQSAELRDAGIEVLMECLHPPTDTPISGDWLRETSLAVRALLTRQNQPFDKFEKDEDRLKLIRSLITQFQNDFKLEHLSENELSVLVAANVLRVMTAQPGAAFSKTAILCYYWIIRELYTADKGDWAVGGARAAPGGFVTAFTTSECVRALLSFADALRNTGELAEEIGKYLKRKKELDDLAPRYFSDASCLKEWTEAEKKRLNLSCFLKIQQLSHYQAFSVTSQLQNIASFENIECYLDKINLTTFKSALISELKQKKAQIDDAVTEIQTYRRKELGEAPDEIKEAHKCFYGGSAQALSQLNTLQKRRLNDVTRSESGHMFAFLAVTHSLHRIEKVENSATNNGSEIFKKIKQECDDAVKEIERLLHPTRNYLSSILDRELALVSLGETWDCQPSELACAAASYGKLTREWNKDARFNRAVKDLSKMVSSRGQFANPRHFHEQADGTRHITENGTILHSMAQLLHHVCDSEIDIGLPKRLLRFFEDTRASHAYNICSFSARDITLPLIDRLIEHPPEISKKLSQDLIAKLKLFKKSPGNKSNFFAHSLARELANELNRAIHARPEGSENEFKEICKILNMKRVDNLSTSSKKGWMWEFSQPPFKTDLTATAIAVMALAKINEMLDAQINHMILEHFNVKKKGLELHPDLSLDDLFYPDYGLRLAPDHIKREDSVAITLLRMRAHVSRLSFPGSERLYSLVLHGPAGTGKTTLVEALAVSCDVPLVEVTPSDLVKYGEADIEERARAVFEALSMLTRAVILLDEFDPVLKRREISGNEKLNVFSFLTPGMLPKLKELNNEAKKRAVAYVLVTNLIGKLDEAAVRKGRFDERMGIYPPDLLSRTGRFLDQISQSKFMIDNTIPEKLAKKRIVEVIRLTQGKGMTSLGPPGWFKRSDSPKKKTPFHYIIGGEKFVDPEPDDEFGDVQGEGPSAALEWQQWKWVSDWDNPAKKTGKDEISEDNAFNKLCAWLNARPDNVESLPSKPAQGQWEVLVDCGRRLLIRHLNDDKDGS